MQVDGYFYQNEGNNRVLDVSDVNGTTGALAKFSGTNKVTTGPSIKTGASAPTHCG